MLQLMPGQSSPLAPQAVLSHQFTKGTNLSLRWQCNFSSECNSPTKNPHREHLTGLWASQVSSHPALLLNLQGSGLHQGQVCFSLAQSLRTSRASSPLPGTKFPSATADLGVSPQAESRYKLFHLKSLGSFVQLKHCVFSHFMYLTQVPGFINKCVCTDFSIA